MAQPTLDNTTTKLMFMIVTLLTATLGMKVDDAISCDVVDEDACYMDTCSYALGASKCPWVQQADAHYDASSPTTPTKRRRIDPFSDNHTGPSTPATAEPTTPTRRRRYDPFADGPTPEKARYPSELDILVHTPVKAGASSGEKTEPAEDPATALERLKLLQGQVLHGESPLRDEIFKYAYGRFSDDPDRNEQFRFEWDEIQQYWGDDLIHPHRPETWIQDNGFTLMHAVIELGAFDVLEWLLTHGAADREWIAAATKYDPPAPAGFQKRRRWGKGMDMASDLGCSPLKRAVEMEQPECVSMLLKHGARKDYRPRGGGCTAGEAARSNKKFEIARIIEEHEDDRIVTDPFRGPSMAGPEYVTLPLGSKL